MIRRSRKPGGGPFLALPLALLLASCSSVVEADGHYAIRNVTLIDGTGADPRPGVTVVFANGRIAQIADAGDVQLSANVPSVDATGQWLVPGYIDTHTHLPPSDRLEATLQQLLDHGITASRVTATVTDYGVDTRERIESGSLRGPTLRVAGALIDGPGSPWGFATEVETPEGARAEVRLQAAAGVDFIKVYTLLPPPVIGAAIEEAHALGLEVLGHVGMTNWHEAIDLGIDALLHSAMAGMAHGMVREEDRARFAEFFIPNFTGFDPELFPELVQAIDPSVVEELASKLAANDVVLDPNLVLMEAVIRGDEPEVFRALMPEEQWGDFAVHPYSAFWSDQARAGAKEALPYFFDAVRTFHEAGALVTAGTDIENAWMTPGVSFHRELELLVEAGLTEADVLGVATANGAIAMGMASELGTVEVGKRADVVLLEADPLADIRNTARIVGVYQAGRIVTGN